MILRVSAVQLILAAAALAVGGTLQGAIGFGSMLVAAPILILIEPQLVPAPASVAATVLVALIAFRDRASVDRVGVAWVLAGRVPGTVAGGLVVAVLAQRHLEVAFGLILLVEVAISVRHPHLARTPAVLLGVGALSGVMGTTTSVGGPPLALVYQHEDGPTLRGTLNAIFLVGSILSLATLAAVGELGTREWQWGLAISPGIVVGFALSRHVIPHVDERSLRPAVLGIAALSAVAVLVRAAL